MYPKHQGTQRRPRRSGIETFCDRIRTISGHLSRLKVEALTSGEKDQIASALLDLKRQAGASLELLTCRNTPEDH